jgi:SAM-dependent methyltransferase
MRRDLLEMLRCPRCRGDRSFDLAERDVDQREVRTGELTCRSCGHVAAVDDGIVDLMHDPPDYVVREAAGLERFADEMRKDGWGRERVLNLPDELSGYWYSQRAAMEQLFETVELAPGSTIVDIGANTCWASNEFAERGLNVIALDITPIELQGLRTAEWWMDANDVYFERMVSVMFDPAIATDSVDYVFTAQVLHHNHRDHLHRTLRELYRILKPGGKLLAINEPLRFLTDLKRDHAAEVDQYEGHEHVYFLPGYVMAARRAGFDVQVMPPNTSPVLRRETLELRFDDSVALSARKFALQMLRKAPLGMRAFGMYKLLFGRHVSLSMFCEKPTTA